jgi:DNA-binding transcriptional LysR family regulator
LALVAYDELSRVDLNLLLAFDVLMQEKNTSRAAERLFISQSAMSKALSRLRKMLNDDLFIRQAQGLKPTAKAEALAEPVRALLANAHQLIFPGEFDARNASGEIHLGIPEPFAVFVVPRLIEILEKNAPKIVLQSHNIIELYRDQLRNGLLDFCVYHDEHWSEFSRETLGYHYVVCLMHKDHPLAALDCLDEETFFSSRRVFYNTPISQGGDLAPYVERSRRSNEGRCCILETSQLSLAIEVLRSNDAIMTVPPGTKDLYICQGQFVERPVEIECLKDVALEVCLIQHPRTQSSPVHNWVAEHIKSIVLNTITDRRN